MTPSAASHLGLLCLPCPRKYKGFTGHILRTLKHSSILTCQGFPSSINDLPVFPSIVKPSKSQHERTWITFTMLVLFVLMLNVPANNFFSHVGTEPPLPGYCQYISWSKCFFAQGHNTAEVGIIPPTSRSGVRDSTTRPPRPLLLL